MPYVSFQNLFYGGTCNAILSNSSTASYQDDFTEYRAARFYCSSRKSCYGTLVHLV